MTWEPIDHVCKICSARLMQSGDLIRCHTCGTECRGEDPTPICGCGMFPGAVPRSPNPRAKHSKGLFRCMPNPRRDAASPALFVTRMVDAEGNPILPPEHAA